METGITRSWANFASSVSFSDLPSEVIDYTKLIILDTVICGLAARHLERSQMMHGVLKSLGGHEESTVFGINQKFPAPLAAMANAEIMNYLDADDTFFTSSHFAAINVAAALAEAERCGSSGKDLILATAVGFDINARLNLASVVIREKEDEELEWAQVQGMGFSGFGAAIASGILRKFDSEKMSNLLGLAGWMATTPTANSTANTTTFSSMKYANYAGSALSGLLSAALAENGYVSEYACLDNGEFLRCQGSLDSRNELLTEDLGKKWWITETAVKFYPSCRYTHGPIDILKRLMQEESIAPADIDKIVIYINPMGYALQAFRCPEQSITDDHRAPLNGAFNIPYAMALAALGRTPGPLWYSVENLNDPKVWALARKIITQPDAAAYEEVRSGIRSKIGRFRKTPASIKVHAKGREFLRNTEYVKGDSWSPETVTKWSDIEKKFYDFCNDSIPTEKIDQLLKQFRDLENVPNISRNLILS